MYIWLSQQWMRCATTLVTNGPSDAGPRAGVGSRVGLRRYMAADLNELQLVGLYEN